MPRDFRKIVAWQRSHELTVAVYRATQSFPAEERFGLTSQLRRAAYSTPANIAEGANRGSKKEYLHFLFISLASLREVEYFLILAADLGYLTREQHAELEEGVYGSFSALTGLISSVKKQTGKWGTAVAFLLSSIAVAVTRGHMGFRC